MNVASFHVRDATEADAPAILAIYTHHVLHGLASFEETPPDAAEMTGRMRKVQDRGMPYLVAEEDGNIIGFSYAGPYHTRPAYRYTVENSVYLAEGATRRGVGTALLSEVIARCEALGLRRMVAVIGNSENAGSIALHRKLGFLDVGTIPGTGFKHGRWVNTVLMHRPLGDGNDTLPE